jgi:hypothetical protein
VDAHPGTEGQPRAGLRRRLGGFALNALLVLLALAVVLGGLELLLRARPTVLGYPFANGVLSKYTDGEGGIFYKDRQAQTRFMIPNYTTRMYANGYVWTHRTDALGFRNQPLSIPADIVLLGDSFIYGHGVEFESTVGAILAHLTGLSVDNLARQGDCTLQQAYLVTEFLPLLRPRYVFYFFFQNDLADLHAFLDDATMQAFIDQPLESIHYAHRLDPAQALREREARLGQRSLLARLKQSSYVYRASRWLKWQLGLGKAMAATDSAAEASLAWRYTKKAIVYMRGIARRHDARFVIVPIVPTIPGDGDILRRFAAQEGIDFIDTSALTVAETSLWLPRDGHLSPAGARRFAELVAAYVATHPAAARRAADSGAGASISAKGWRPGPGIGSASVHSQGLERLVVEFARLAQLPGLLERP